MFYRGMTDNPNDGVHHQPQEQGVETFTVDPVITSGLVDPDQELLRTSLSELQEFNVAQRAYTNARRHTDNISYPNARTPALNGHMATRGPRSTNTVVQDIQTRLSTSIGMQFPENCLPSLEPYEETRRCIECNIIPKERIFIFGYFNHSIYYKSRKIINLYTVFIFRLYKQYPCLIM